MENLSKVRDWIEAGKQIGARTSFEEKGKTHWLSIAIQKWEGLYKLHFSKTAESRMRDLDYFDVEGTIRVACFDELAGLVSSLSPFKMNELAPLKGQKVFNPEFD
jgi:hypothetical protein